MFARIAFLVFSCLAVESIQDCVINATVDGEARLYWERSTREKSNDFHVYRAWKESDVFSSMAKGAVEGMCIVDVVERLRELCNRSTLKIQNATHGLLHILKLTVGDSGKFKIEQRFKNLASDHAESMLLRVTDKLLTTQQAEKGSTTQTDDQISPTTAGTLNGSTTIPSHAGFSTNPQKPVKKKTGTIAWIVVGSICGFIGVVALSILFYKKYGARLQVSAKNGAV